MKRIKVKLILIMLALTTVLGGCSDFRDGVMAGLADEGYAYENDADAYKEVTDDASEKATDEAFDEASVSTAGDNATDDSQNAANVAAAETDVSTPDTEYVEYKFRNNKLLNQHYEKHGIEMGFDSKEDYEQAASDVINNPNALYKIEQEDGDGVYYLEETNEFVILSTDGYIRTYFKPDKGKAYFDKQ